MATPNGKGGWDLTDDDVAEVMAESFGHSDLIRELVKAEQALAACERHFNAAAEANAALHMSERVIPNPLASHVALVRANLLHVIESREGN